ncbi:MAG: MBL fold metallo-hydrolase [Planctomycetota bacterium]
MQAFVNLVLMLVPSIISSPQSAAAEGGPGLRKLGEGVYAALDASGGSNAGFIILKDAVVVVDSRANEAEARELLQQIKGVTDRHVKFVINTHHRGDHCGGNAVFVADGASVLAWNKCAELMAGNRELPPQGQATVVFDGKVTIPSAIRDVEIIPIGPANTPGDTMIYLRREGILFAGGVLFAGRYPFMRDGSTTEWIKALRAIEELNPKMIVPGRGALASVQDVVKERRYFEDLRSEVGRLIQEGLSLEEVQKRATTRVNNWEWEDRLRAGNIEKVYGELKR